jgi:hypothetical protein
MFMGQITLSAHSQVAGRSCPRGERLSDSGRSQSPTSSPRKEERGRDP